MKNAFFFTTFLIAVCFAAGACSSAKNENPIVQTTNANSSNDAEDTDIKSALQIIEKSPDAPEGYSQLAIAYIKRARQTGDFSLNSKAETAVKKSLEIDPRNAIALKLSASLHLTFHRFNEALKAGKQLTKDYPQDAFGYGVLADANTELGNYKDAIDAAQKMVDLKPNSSSYARVAHLRSLHGDTEGAIEMFKTAARTTDPSDKEAQSWALVQLGDEYWKYGKYEEAEKVYDEALQNLPNYYLALAAKGKVRASLNDFDGAIKILTDTNNRVPNVETAILLGDIYARQGNGEKAKEHYDLVEVIEKKIGVNNDQKRLALLWADHDWKLDEALAITKHESNERKDIFTTDALAWTLYKKGMLTDAKTAITEAMNLKSNDARILYHAGMIEKDLGNRTESKKLLEQALKLNPAFDLLQAENARKALLELK
ncbi:MAG TPA: tetratricopeptide repeat protein [Pyrinomonadaceae bacterium]|nr:tetratricopeptide repeat protein [Pyrinomonadaceae bacterium]